nr:hypothetical protein [uncultured Alistipes sp.]
MEKSFSAVICLVPEFIDPQVYRTRTFFCFRRGKNRLRKRLVDQIATQTLQKPTGVGDLPFHPLAARHETHAGGLESDKERLGLPVPLHHFPQGRIESPVELLGYEHVVLEYQGIGNILPYDFFVSKQMFGGTAFMGRRSSGRAEESLLQFRRQLRHITVQHILENYSVCGKRPLHVPCTVFIALLDMQNENGNRTFHIIC